jgi:hypothetical protein
VTNVPAESRNGGIQMVVSLARPHPTTGVMQQISQCRSDTLTTLFFLTRPTQH